MRGKLIFLTRDGCANTPLMRGRFDEALKSLKQQMDYEVVDLDKVDASDPRVAYPTPTILVEDEDLFGLPRPTAPSGAT